MSTAYLFLDEGKLFDRVWHDDLIQEMAVDYLDYTITISQPLGIPRG